MYEEKLYEIMSTTFFEVIQNKPNNKFIKMNNLTIIIQKERMIIKGENDYHKSIDLSKEWLDKFNNLINSKAVYFRV